jgi:peroxiredoxin
METKNERFDEREAEGTALSLLVALVSTVAVVALVVGIPCSGSAGVSAISSAGASAVAEGTEAPDLIVKDLSGKDVKLSDYKGKVVVLNFWATWCGPCRAEIPSFVKLRERYHNKGLEIIGLSLDQDDQNGVAAFAERFKINYTVVFGTPEAVEAYGPMNAIPTTVIIDRRGQMRGRHLGMLSFSEIEDAIKDLI